MIDLRECQSPASAQNQPEVLNYQPPAPLRSIAFANASGLCALVGSPILPAFALPLTEGCRPMVGMTAALVVLLPAVGAAMGLVAVRRSRPCEIDVRGVIGFILNLTWLCL
jgi:hypothetical protein